MKRFTAVVLSVLAILSCLTIGASASEVSAEKTLLIHTGENDYSVTAEEVYTYVCCLRLEKKLTAIDAVLSFDPKGLELIDYTFPLLQDSPIGNVDDNSILFTFISDRGKAFSSEDSALIKARFKVKAAQGVYDIKTTITDMAQEEEERVVVEGEILKDFEINEMIEGLSPVSEKRTVLLGDADGDKKVSILDATYIQKKLASLGIPETFNEEAADVNRSAKIDILDATYIQKKLASIQIPYPVGETMETD